MSEPNVARFHAQDAKGKAVSFTVGSEVMDYIEPARTFGREDLAEAGRKGRFQPRLIAVPDYRFKAVSPMVLTLGNQARLTLVRRLGEAVDDSAGWERIDLSAGLDKIVKGPVTAFGAAWAGEGADQKITVAVALERGGRSQILIAYDLSSATDWNAVPWIDYGVRENLTIDALRIMRDAKGIWTTALSAGEGVKQNVYLIRSNRPKSFAKDALVFSVATDLDQIFDVQIGGCDGDGALHVLGAATLEGERTLFTRPFPEYDESDTPVPTSAYTFRCPEAAQVLGLGLNRGETGADLYIGGKGVQCIAARQFARQEDAKQTTVIAPDLAEGVSRLVVGETVAGTASAWALTEDGRLLLAQRPDATGAWSPPLLLRSAVWDIAPVEGEGGVTASLLVVYEHGRASHLWRDTAGIWQEMEIRVADPGEAAAITSFSTNLSVFDEWGAPRIGTRVRLRASVPSILVVNGRSLSVGPLRAVEVATNFQGGISIFNRALSFCPAIYRLEVDGMARSLDINPAAPLYQRFAAMTVDEMRDAKLPGGSAYLLPESYRTGVDSGVLPSLVQAMKQAAELTGVNDNAVPGVELVETISPFSTTLSPGRLKPGYGWGVTSDGKGGLQVLDAAKADALAAKAVGQTGVFAMIGSSLSDLFQAVANGVKGAVSFVIRKASDAVEFICSIGGRIKRFVLGKLEEIAGFFTWIWNTVKTAASKVWSFLKFLFDWGDIIAVRNRLADMLNDDLVGLKAQVLGLKSVVGPAFDDAIKAIEEKGKSLGVRIADRSVLLAPGSAQVAKDQTANAKSKDQVMGSGPGAWIMDKLKTFGRELITIEFPEADEQEDPLAGLMDDQKAILGDLAKELGTDFKTIFGEGGFSLSDFDLAKIQKLILTICFRIADAGTRAMKSLVLRLIEVLAGVIETFRMILFARVRLPFIEKLVKLVSGASADVSARLVDVIMLPVAVLTTITYKLVFGEAPVKSALAEKLPAMTVATAQSSGFMRQLMFIKEMASTYIGFVTVILDAIPASLPTPAQAATTMLQWFGWGAGFISHLFGNNPFASTRVKPKATRNCDTVIFLIGLFQYFMRYNKLKMFPTLDPATYLLFAYQAAAAETVAFALQLVFKVVGYLLDDDARDGWELVQFSGRCAAQGVLQASRLVEEPATKETMVVGAALGDLFLNLGVGLTRHAIAYTREASAPTPRPAR